MMREWANRKSPSSFCSIAVSIFTYYDVNNEGKEVCQSDAKRVYDSAVSTSMNS